MLQKKLEEGKGSDFNQAFSKAVEPLLPSLMVDQFGNYLCQKLFEVVSPSELSAHVSTLRPTLIQACLNVHGTRAVQTMLDKVVQT